MPVFPSLFIGLGGAGRTVLLGAKQTLIEHRERIFPDPAIRTRVERQFGTNAKLPYLKMLSIDSSHSERVGLGATRVSASLDPDECIMASINQAQAAAFQRVPNTDLKMASWFDPALLAAPIPPDACGQTRPWGRVAFMHNYANIRAQIEGAINSLRDAATVQACIDMGIDYQTDQFRVYIAFSCSGGTGAGMCLDVPYLIRDIFRNMPGQPGLLIEALVGLPTLYSENYATRVYANGYAVLTELEHYCRTPEDTEANIAGAPSRFSPPWPTEPATPMIIAPAYNSIWLMGRSAPGLQLPAGADPGHPAMKTSREAILRMAGEWLALRRVDMPDSPMNYGLRAFAAPFNYLGENADAFAPGEVARLPFLQGANNIAQNNVVRMSRRFGSFGLSKIDAGTWLRFQDAAHRLASQSLSDMDGTTLNGEGPVDDVWKTVFPNTDQFGVGAALRRLIDLPPGGQTLSGRLDGEADAVRDDWINQVLDTNSDPVPIFNQLKDNFFATRVAAGNQPGTFTVQVNQSAVAAKNALLVKVDEAMAKALAKPGIGFSVAQAFLTRLIDGLTASVKDNNALAETESDNSVGASEDASSMVECLSTYRSSMHQNTIRKICSELGCEDAKECFAAQHQANLSTTSSDVAGALLKTNLPELQRQLTNLRADVAALVTLLDTNRKLLGELPVTLLTTSVVAPNDDSFYEDGNGQSLTNSVTRTTQPDLQSVLGNLWSQRERFRPAGRETLADAYLSQCQLVIRHHLRQPPNAAIGFSQLFGEQEYAPRLQQLSSRAGPWVVTSPYLGLTFGGANPVMSTSGVLLAENVLGAELAATVAERVQAAALSTAAIRQTLAQQVGAPPVLGAFAPDIVLATKSILGIPIAIVPEIANYKRTYDMMVGGQLAVVGPDGQEAATTAFHLEADSDRYTSIVIPTPEEGAAMAAAAWTFVRAIAFGLIRPYMTAGVIPRLEFEMAVNDFHGIQMIPQGTRTQLLGALAQGGRRWEDLEARIQGQMQELAMLAPIELHKLLAAHLANLRAPASPMRGNPLLISSLRQALEQSDVREVQGNSAPNDITVSVSSIFNNRDEALAMTPGGYYTRRGA